MLVGKTQFQQAVTAAWCPAVSGKLIATGSLDGGGVSFDENEASLVVHKVDLSTGTLTQVKERRVRDARFAALAWGGEQDNVIAGGMTDGTVKLWNADGLELNDAGIISAHDKGCTVRSLSFNPVVKHQIVHGGSDKRVIVTDLSASSGPASTAVTDALTQHTGEVSSVSWNVETPHILASSSMDGVCSVWDTRSRKSFCDIRDPRSASTIVVKWSPKTGFHLVTGSDSGIVRLFDLRSSKTTPLAELQAHSAGVFDVSWCPQDPGYLASCGKDNKLIVWDLYTLQPMQEVTNTDAGQSTSHSNQGISFDRQGPALHMGGSSLGVSADALFAGAAPPSDFGPGSAASSRRYEIHWSPSAPGVLSACSFDRSIQLLSLITNVSGKNAQNQIVRSPPWMARKSGVSFGFGGRLVSFNSIQSAMVDGDQTAQPTVEMKNCHYAASAEMDSAAGARMVNFERSLSQAMLHDAAPSHDHLAAFCASQASQSPNENEQEVWKFMRVLFEEQNPRVAVQKYLGYDEEAVSREVDLSILPPEEDIAGQASAEYQAPPAQYEDDTSEDSPVDEAIMRSLTVGNFAAAVALCLQHDRAADALVISSLGGAPLMKRAHQAYLESQSAKRRVMRLAKSIFEENTQATVVRGTNLSRAGSWKQTLAFLMTYTRPEDFPSQCDALAQRLEYEVGDILGATICYMLSRNVEKSAELWTSLSPKDDVALVEKAIVFQKVLPNPQALNDDRVMMQRFARLASKLADEGEFDIASKYASMAQGVDGDANELVQRIEYGLKWTAESQARAAEAENAAREAELRAQQEFEAAQQQQVGMGANHVGNGYYGYGGASGTYGNGVNGGTYDQAAHTYAGPQTTSYDAGYNAGPSQVGGQAYFAPPSSNYGQMPASTPLPGPTFGMAANVYPNPTAVQPMAPPAPTQSSSTYSAFPGAVPMNATSYGGMVSAPLNQTLNSAYAAPPATNPMMMMGSTFNAPKMIAPPPSTSGFLPPTSSIPAPSSAAPPRVRENDGFGSTAGNPDAGAKYGNRLAGGGLVPSPAQTNVAVQQAPPKPPKVPDSMMPALLSIQRLLATLKAKYTTGMEERRLREAEKGEEILRAAIAIGSLSDFFLAKLREIAAAFDRGSIAEAHNLHITLSSSVDWKEHKEWLKGLGHLIAVAQKDMQPSIVAQAAGPPASMPPAAPTYGAPVGHADPSPHPGPAYGGPPAPAYGQSAAGPGGYRGSPPAYPSAAGGPPNYYTGPKY